MGSVSSVLSKDNLVLLPAGVFLFSLPFTHTIAVRLICLFAAACIVFYQWWRRPPPTPPCKGPLAFWFVVCFLASMWSIEPDYSWGEFRNEVVYALMTGTVFYYSTKNEAVWQIWRTILVSAFLVVSLHAIFNYFRLGDWAAAGLVGDRNAYSTYIVVIAPFLFLTTAQTGIRSRAGKLLWLTIALALITGYLTLNRIMWVTLMIETAIFVFLYLRKSAVTATKKRRVRLAIVTAICAVFAVQFFLVSHVGSTQMKKSFSEDPRLHIWSYALKRMEERPLSGYGYGRGILRRDFRTHFNDPLHWHAHNMVLNYTMEAGLLGAAALLWLFAALVREFWKLYRSRHRISWELGTFGLALLLGIVTKTMTDDILVRDNALLFWSLVGMCLGLVRHSFTQEVLSGEAS